MNDRAGRSETVRVLVADDQRLVRDGIASLLAIQDGIEVVGTAANGEQAIEQAVALSPHVILLDVRMPGMDGVTAAGALRRLLPDCQVLMLTTFDDEEYVVEALRAGASGYLLKDMTAEHLARAVRLAHAGIHQLDPSVAGKLVGLLGRPGRPPSDAPGRQGTGLEADDAWPNLTEREMEVVGLIATGATNREIAARLVITEGTVKNHVSSILGRLGLRDRTEAAIYAHRRGWI